MKADFKLIEEESRQNKNSRFLSGITRSYPTNINYNKMRSFSYQLEVFYLYQHTVLSYLCYSVLDEIKLGYSIGLNSTILTCPFSFIYLLSISVPSKSKKRKMFFGCLHKFFTSMKGVFDVLNFHFVNIIISRLKRN